MNNLRQFVFDRKTMAKVEMYYNLIFYHYLNRARLPFILYF